MYATPVARMEDITEVNVRQGADESNNGRNWQRKLEFAIPRKSFCGKHYRPAVDVVDDYDYDCDAADG